MRFYPFFLAAGTRHFSISRRQKGTKRGKKRAKTKKNEKKTKKNAKKA